MSRKEPVNEITGDLLRKAKDAQRQVHYEQGNAVFEMVTNLASRRFKLRGIFPAMLMAAALAWISCSVYKDANSEHMLVKQRQNAETMLVQRGIMFDDVKYVSAAETANEFRRKGYYGEPHRLTFEHYSPALRDHLLDFCIDNRRVKVLAHFRASPGWSELVTEERQAKTDLILDNPLSHVSREDLEVSIAVARSKKNALLAWYHDNPDYLEKVDLSHFNEDWMRSFEKRLKSAPKVEEKLFDVSGGVQNASRGNNENGATIR